MEKMLEIYASEVAAFIGKHQYSSQNTIFEKIAIRTGHKKPRVIEEKLKRKIVNECVEEAKKVEEAANPIELNEHLAAYTEKVNTALAPHTEELNEEDKRDVLSAPIKSRGCKKEKTGLDSCEKKLNISIVDRNTRRGELVIDKCKIVGRPDGFAMINETENIIENKARIRMNTGAPIYDMIQLLVYMKMFGCKRGVLYEQFPDGNSRSTNYCLRDADWEVVINGISAAYKLYSEKIEEYEQKRRKVD